MADRKTGDLVFIHGSYSIPEKFLPNDLRNTDVI